MENQFEQLGVIEPIRKAVADMGFEAPTDVQARVIPTIIKSNDLIVMSETGSGKTAAFGIPVLQGVSENAGKKALILTPTRELAVQVDKEINLLSKHMSVKTTAVYGQHNMQQEIKELNSGVSVISGTPGRVFHHIKEKNLKVKEIGYLVLDEADRMLDMGFIDQVIQIIKALPKDRVTLLFSATMPPAIKGIVHSYMNSPESIELSTDTKTVDTVHQFYYKVARNEKRMKLDFVLKAEQPDSCMVFCNTRDEVDRVHRFLTNKGYFAMALHGTKTQSNRMKTIDKFKNGDLQILVATDIAARGIHIDDLSLVINYDIPQDKDNYIHRIGRTGRAGNGGRAVALITSEDIFNLYEIEEHINMLIEEEELPSQEAVEEIVKNASGKWAGKKYTPPKRSESQNNHKKHNKGKKPHHSNKHKQHHQSDKPKNNNYKNDKSDNNKGKTHHKPNHNKDSQHPKAGHNKSQKRNSNYKGKNYDPNYNANKRNTGNQQNTGKPDYKPYKKPETKVTPKVDTKPEVKPVEAAKKKGFMEKLSGLFKKKDK